MILTSTVKIKSRSACLAPVKTTREIPHDKIPEAMKQINKISLCAPVRLGDIIIKDCIQKGTNLVVTNTILK